MLQLDPAVPGVYSGNPYPFGIDPVIKLNCSRIVCISILFLHIRYALSPEAMLFTSRSLPVLYIVVVMLFFSSQGYIVLTVLHRQQQNDKQEGTSILPKSGLVLQSLLCHQSAGLGFLT